MKKNYFLFLIFCSLFAEAQIGIGTTSPQATLDVREANPASPTIQAGIAIPQVSVLPASGNRAGQLIFLTTNNLYYYFDGVSWKALTSQIFSFGDIKHGFQASDHSGWVLLDGRLKTTLTANQQISATALGIGANLPNISDKSIVGVSGTKPLNSTNGSSSVTINQNQLPNVTLSTSSDGAHVHDAGTPVRVLLNILGQQFLAASSNTVATSSAGAHSHTTSSINGNVAQQPLNIQNPYLALNGFIYLGL